jgi:hypothetical protein
MQVEPRGVKLLYTEARLVTSSEVLMAAQSVDPVHRYAPDDQRVPPKSRWRFTLRDWSLRHHRDRERPANLRAGVEPRHGYPFEPRF